MTVYACQILYEINLIVKKLDYSLVTQSLVDRDLSNHMLTQLLDFSMVWFLKHDLGCVFFVPVKR